MSAGRRRSVLRAGFDALAHWRFAALLLAVTLLPALLSASALWPALRDGFSQTLAGDHVLRNDPLLAPADVTDFFHAESPAIAGAWHAAWSAALFGILVQIFFTGGFVRSLNRPIRPTVADFLEGSRRDFAHNLKCFLVFVVAAALVIGLWAAAVFGTGKKLLEGRPPGDPAFLAIRIIGIVIALLLYAILSLWHDFARAARRVDPRIRAWRAYGFARRRLSGRWSAAIGLFLFWVIVGSVAFLLLFALGWSLRAVSTAGVVLLFLVQLATLSVRPLVRVATWGSYIALLDRASFPPQSATVRVPPITPAPESEVASSAPLPDESPR